MKNFLRRHVLGLLCAFALSLLSASTFGYLTPSGVPVHTHANAQQGGGALGPITGTFSSTKACASGFTRVSPNVCITSTAPFSYTGMTTGICTLVTAPAVDLKSYIILSQATSSADNALGSRAVGLGFYSTVACGSLIGNLNISSAQEQVAQVAGTALSTSTSQVIVVPASVGSNLWLRCNNFGGSNNVCLYGLYGYTD